MRLETARDQFIADKRTVTKKRRPASPHTLRSYLGHLNGFIDWVQVTTGKHSVLQMTAELVRAYLGHRSERNVSGHSLSLDSVVLREFAAWGAKRRYWRAEDIDDIPSIGKPDTLPQAYDATERDALMGLVLPLEDEVLRGLLYFGGLRAHECLGLRLRDLTPPHGLPNGETIPGALRIWGKGAKERIVPIHDELWGTLVGYLKTLGKPPLDRTLLAKSDGSPWGYHMIQRRLKTWGKAAKVTRAKSHRVRHTFATDVLDNGGDIREVRDLLGHASLATTQVYLKLTEKRKAEAVARLPRFRTITTPSRDSSPSPTADSGSRENASENRADR